MNRLFRISSGVLVLAIAPAAIAAGESSREGAVKAAEKQLAEGGAPNAYVGSEACLACHPSYASWRTSLHATGLKIAPDDSHSMSVRFGVNGVFT